jgi:hypothetical protein
VPEELLEAVFRLLDAMCRDWPERGSLLAVRGAARATLVPEGDFALTCLCALLPTQAAGCCRSWRRVGLHVFAPTRWSERPHTDWATPARLLVPVRAHTNSVACSHMKGVRALLLTPRRRPRCRAAKGPLGTHMKCYIQRERVKGSLKRRCARRGGPALPTCQVVTAMLCAGAALPGRPACALAAR